MEKNNKLNYKAPALEVVVVELEQGIAAGSVTVTPGSAPGFAPEVADFGSEVIGGGAAQDL